LSFPGVVSAAAVGSLRQQRIMAGCGVEIKEIAR
jgi:hypothetical protein